MPIGIIVWLVLIFIIVLGTVPNFLTMLFCSSAIVISAYFLLRWIGRKLFRFLASKINGESVAFFAEADIEAEREKAIDEWEQKWGRPHPTRINKPLIHKKR